MIEFIKTNQAEPFLLFKDNYKKAYAMNQKNIEAVCISSFNKLTNEVDSRFVNIKFLDNDELIFFTNYNSPKSIAFSTHDQVAATIFWESINVQIRMKAKILKTKKSFNNDYFSSRSFKKNALAISSNQSRKIKSYSDVIKKYEESISKDNLLICPEYWGGFSLKPYEIEFWKGNHSRLNKRDLYVNNNKKWNHYVLEP